MRKLAKLVTVARISLAALVAKIDATRGERPLASALRLYALANRQ